MSDYAHLTAAERDRLAALKADGLSLRAIARALSRAASTISRELRRNALDSGAYRPHVADGAYMLRRQRAAVLERDAKLAAYVTDRLAEGWAPEQVAGRLRLGSRPACGRLARRPSTAGSSRWPEDGTALAFLTRRRARRKKRSGRASRDTIAEKTIFHSDLTTLMLVRPWGMGKLTW